MRKGNVLTPVCPFTGEVRVRSGEGWVSVGVGFPGGCLEVGDGGWGYGRQLVGMHPAGMLSCYMKIRNKIQSNREEIESDEQIDRDRQMARQTDRCTDKYTNRQTDR